MEPHNNLQISSVPLARIWVAISVALQLPVMLRICLAMLIAWQDSCRPMF